MVGTGIGRKSLEIEQRFHANFIIMPWKGGTDGSVLYVPNIWSNSFSLILLPNFFFSTSSFLPPRFIYIPCLLNSFRLSHASDSIELSPLVCLHLTSVYVYASATLREHYICCLRVHIRQAERSVAFMKALSIFGCRFVRYSPFIPKSCPILENEIIDNKNVWVVLFMVRFIQFLAS